MRRFENQVAIVTGAGRGIGKAVAARLFEEGAAVAILDIDGDSAAVAAEEIASSDARVLSFAADVTDEMAVSHVFDSVASRLGRLSVLINNAGTYPHIPIEDCSLADWRRIITTNLDSAFLCTRSAFPVMKAAGYGRIVNLSSEVFYSGLEKVSAYAASKGGVIGLTRVAATEGGPFGITVNAVAPGLIETPGVMTDIAEHFDDILPYQTVKRRGQPKDIVECIAFLASPDASFTNGETLSANGGMSYR